MSELLVSLGAGLAIIVLLNVNEVIRNGCEAKVQRRIPGRGRAGVRIGRKARAGARNASSI